jgi:hypothetical protein
VIREKLLVVVALRDGERELDGGHRFLRARAGAYVAIIA